MTGQVSLTAVWSLFSLAGIIFLLFWQHGTYRLDVFRQELFGLRDRLFDDARGGMIDFDHPAYGMLRSMTNGFIRFAHRLSFGQLLVFLLLVDERELRRDTSFETRWERAVRDVSPEVRGRMEKYRLDVHVCVLKNVVLSSGLLLVTVIGPAAVYMVGVQLVQKLRTRFAVPINSIDSAAYAYGQ